MAQKKRLKGAFPQLPQRCHMKGGDEQRVEGGAEGKVSWLKEGAGADGG